MNPVRATQGKTFKSNEEEFGAANVLDKDLSTEISDGTDWLKIEFDTTYQYHIHKVLIHYIFFNNWYDSSYFCAVIEENFKACVNTHNHVDVSVYKGDVKQKSCGTLQLTYGLEQSDQIYALLCNGVIGDTVVLSKNSSSFSTIAIAEIAVISVLKSGNIYLKKSLYPRPRLPYGYE